MRNDGKLIQPALDFSAPALSEWNPATEEVAPAPTPVVETAHPAVYVATDDDLPEIFFRKL